MGKTEIARRLAELVGAPFVKIEATKFTEVGYHGRDVESDDPRPARDAIQHGQGRVQAESSRSRRSSRSRNGCWIYSCRARMARRPADEVNPSPKTRPAHAREDAREAARRRTRRPDVEISCEHKPDIAGDARQRGHGAWSRTSRTCSRSMHAEQRRESNRCRSAMPDACSVEQEGEKLIDKDKIIQIAIEQDRGQRHRLPRRDRQDRRQRARATGRMSRRQGVQRDLLPIVEGSTVTTKYGPVKTDHILFIAAGAFHCSSPADLMPELQGRFPIRVELCR